MLLDQDGNRLQQLLPVLFHQLVERAHGNLRRQPELRYPKHESGLVLYLAGGKRGVQGANSCSNPLLLKG